MRQPPDGTVAFDYRGDHYQMVFDMQAIAFFEREADASIIEALGSLEAAQKGGRPPKVSQLAFLMQAGLRRHHPELSAEDALAMAGDPAVQAALGTSVQAAMPDADPSAAGNGKVPAGGTGTKSSKARSKRA